MVVGFETNSKNGKSFDMRIVTDAKEAETVIRSLKEASKPVPRVREPDNWDDIKLIANKPKQQSFF